MKKIKIVVENFESISDAQENNLVGGFSKSYSLGKDKIVIEGPSNNCWGGNCSSGCGVNGNNSCNTVVGCS